MSQPFKCVLSANLAGNQEVVASKANRPMHITRKIPELQTSGDVRCAENEPTFGLSPHHHCPYLIKEQNRPVKELLRTRQSYRTFAALIGDSFHAASGKLVARQLNDLYRVAELEIVNAFMAICMRSVAENFCADKRHRHGSALH
jgi:hypothetical protein